MRQNWTDCLFSQWSPHVGDPGLGGWIAFTAYGLACALCLLAFGRRPQRQLRRLGQGLAAVLAALMINKQLDLQSALTGLARCFLQERGWYEARQWLQVFAVLALVLICIMVGAMLLRGMRAHLSLVWPALLGVFCLMGFVAVRAYGIHHLERFVGLVLHKGGLTTLLELGGIALICANAVWLLTPRHRPDPERKPNAARGDE